jgi:predicted nucleotide-binding protein
MQHDGTSVDRSRVFVVHGRDEELRKSMFDFLRSIGLDPIEWSQAIQMTGKASPFIGEILDSAFQNAQAVVVLLTGDDEARLHPKFHEQETSDDEKILTPQARPNVLFEAGLAMGTYAERTVLVEIGTLRPFSDIAGRHVVRLDNSAKKRQDLVQRLRTAGCSINTNGTDWLETGNFELVAQLELQKDETSNSATDQLSPTHIKILEILKMTLTNASGISRRLEMRRLTVLPFLRDLLEQGFVSKNGEDINNAHFSLEESGIRYLDSIGKL